MPRLTLGSHSKLPGSSPLPPGRWWTHGRPSELLGRVDYHSCTVARQISGMDDIPDLSAEIAEAATQPASFQSDGQQVQSRPISDLIAADQYLAKKRAARRRGVWGQISIAKMVPPGTGGDRC